MGEPLRYNITDWHQLRDCLSNNSRDLRIVVSDIFNDDILTGLRIQVVHQLFGPLFVCVLNAEGELITVPTGSEQIEFTTERILQELAKYGFFVTFDEVKNLPQDQLDFLYTIMGLGYDKLRLLAVKGKDMPNQMYIMVFDVDKAPASWLINTHVATYAEYTSVLQVGGAINITEKAKRWQWNWLDFVANIEDILEENDYNRT